MTIQQIQTQYANGNISVTIDNETIPIATKEIIKKHTQFIQEKQIDNVLNNPISVKLFLSSFYINSEVTEEIYEDGNYDENSPYINQLNSNPYEDYVERGIIKIIIKDAQTNIICIEENVLFTNGKIEAQFDNNLKLGEYILTAEYAGSQYYLPTNINIHFTISKRKVKCEISETNLIAHPGETITTNIHLTDLITGTNISNILLYYSFNNSEYITQTNAQGIATLNILIPEIDPNKCSTEFIRNNESYDEENNVGEYYWDENGFLQPIIQETEPINNVEENISITEEEQINKKYYAHMYPLTIYVNNNTYVIDNFVQYIIAAKNDTDIVIYDSFEQNSQWYIRGNVIEANSAKTTKYGKIKLKLDEINYENNVYIDDNGYFEFNVDTYNLIEATSNNKNPEAPTNYSPLENTIIILENEYNNNIIERDYVKKNGINYVASVKSFNTKKSVKEGMISFVIFNNQNKEIYRYVSELDLTGKAYFRFDVSTIGTYSIKAYYYGIFEYKDSESDIQSYQIIENEE